jgi:hypothetical protein
LLLDEMKNAPFDLVRQNMVCRNHFLFEGISNSLQRDGVGRPSVLRELLEQNDLHGNSKQQEQMIKDVAAIAFAGT